MSSSDFREIVMKGDVGKAESLFRAAVSAYCSLTRPSRRTATQLEDLTLPLFDLVSTASRRYVAAALSECDIVPAALVRRLCEESVDIAAPLLIRSRALTDVDLIGLIGRKGLPHARAIARRPRLNETIGHLIRALEGSVSASLSASRPAASAERTNFEARQDRAEAPVPDRLMAGEKVRQKLRMMMRADDKAPQTSNDVPAADATGYAKLRDAALTGNRHYFQAALADVLKLNAETARSVLGATSYSSLLASLRALDLGEEQAFLLTVAVYPSQFPHPESVRLFLERYRALERETALERVRGWKVEMVAAWIHRNAARPRGLGGSAGDPAELKAS